MVRFYEIPMSHSFNVVSIENAHQRYKKFIDHVVSRGENLTKKKIYLIGNFLL